jgi:AraC-like DNA-binding protein
MSPLLSLGARQPVNSWLIRLCRARDMLRGIHDRQVSIGEAAREAALSPYHFIRVFKAVFGQTPHQALIAARVDRAKHLLIVGDLSVTEICVEVGFASLGTFSDLFSRRVGVPPSVYRQQSRSMMQVSGTIPRQLVPGCLSLMAWPEPANEDSQFSGSAPAPAGPDSGHEAATH